MTQVLTSKFFLDSNQRLQKHYPNGLKQSAASHPCVKMCKPWCAC